MKPEIHPKYYSQAKVICSCGHTFTTGATQQELKIENHLYVVLKVRL